MAKTSKSISADDGDGSELIGNIDSSIVSDDSGPDSGIRELPEPASADNGNDDGIGDPLAGINTDESTREPARAGRKPGSGDSGRSRTSGAKSGSKNQKTLDIKDAGQEALAVQIVGLHHIAGILTGQPQVCAITIEQARGLTAAVSGVMAQYKIKPNPKVTAWLNLAGVLGVVYVPKALLFREIAKEKRRAAANASPFSVVKEPAPVNDPAASGNVPGRIVIG